MDSIAQAKPNTESVEEVKPVALQQLPLPDELASWESHDLEKLEKGLVRRLDTCLLPAVIVLFLMNILDRSEDSMTWGETPADSSQKQHRQRENRGTARNPGNLKQPVQHLFDDILCGLSVSTPPLPSRVLKLNFSRYHHPAPLEPGHHQSQALDLHRFRHCRMGSGFHVSSVHPQLRGTVHVPFYPWTRGRSLPTGRLFLDVVLV